MSLAEQMATGWGTERNHSLCFNGLMDGLLIGEEPVPIGFKLEPEGIACGAGPDKAIRFSDRQKDEPELETPAQLVD